eukprot:TRINITY_DN5452_c0_g3_i2.p1 TRINITY_DN5452_c0_g3~~TRINITY_DN5452_c0_g3_i2.p1  ORF type:complete len:245 (+),score=14.35 TRINITY_DN5452_c0_g3_i2:199-933(+)
MCIRDSPNPNPAPDPGGPSPPWESAARPDTTPSHGGCSHEYESDFETDTDSDHDTDLIQPDIVALTLDTFIPGTGQVPAAQITPSPLLYTPKALLHQPHPVEKKCTLEESHVQTEMESEHKPPEPVLVHANEPQGQDIDAPDPLLLAARQNTMARPSGVECNPLGLGLGLEKSMMRPSGVECNPVVDSLFGQRDTRAHRHRAHRSDRTNPNKTRAPNPRVPKPRRPRVSNPGPSARVPEPNSRK